MIVKWAVTDFDLEALRANRGREKDAGHHDGNEQKFVFYHTRLIRARSFPHMGFSGEGIRQQFQERGR